MGQLDGKVALITGAAAGIGQGIASEFAKAGATLAICDVQPKVRQVATNIAAETGRRVSWWSADVRDARHVKRFVDEAAFEFGGIDIVVANAGVWRRTDPLSDPWEKGLSEWDVIVETNLRGVFLTGRAAMPHLVNRGGGDIINIATDHICPPPGFATGGGTLMDIYDASKWGVNGLTQSWAKYLRGQKVRVNALCMDAVDSEMVRYASGPNLTPEHIAGFMQPWQIGQLALDLLAEGPDGRTGENIGVWRDHPVVLPPRQPELPSRHR